MSQERDRIQQMVQQGKLTRAEADELLAALEPQEAGQPRAAAVGTQAHPHRSLHIHVDEAGRESVDLRFPMALAGVGLNILARRGSATVNVDGKEVPVDLDEIRRLIADPSFEGELMHVHSGDGADVFLNVE
jgi:type II secretory pathway component HofQ